RAMKKDFSRDRKNRSLQLEAQAHIQLHRKICEMFENGSPNPYDQDFLKLLHEEFYKELPEEFKTAVNKNNEKKKKKTGKFRDREVKVGNHIGPSSRHLEAFINRFEKFYDPGVFTNKSNIRRIISIAAAHHRLAWIHPFIDGNGRVVRLFSDACFIAEDL